MSHQADSSFFETKREWSKKKDEILRQYLFPYLSKVKELRRPILVVDGFAGPGKYEDGELGSPLIFCEAADPLVADGVDIEVLCIERDEELFSRLKSNTNAYSFCDPRIGEFKDFVGEIEAQAKSGKTIFLYIDPFKPSSLNWNDLELVFKHVYLTGTSVEVLINFMAPTFKRIAWLELKRQSPGLKSDGAEIEEDELKEDLSESNLNTIVGGDWWKEVLTTSPPERQIPELMIGIKKRLHAYFRVVCYVPVDDTAGNTKYFMMFGSRHRDALILMNDAMLKARGFTEFDANPLYAEQSLETDILDASASPIKRKDLVAKIVEQRFCVYTKSEIIKSIRNLLTPPNKRLESSTGKTIINDETEVRRV